MKELDKNKLILPIAIVLGCLILGGFFYVIQIAKQKSIEKQQQIELQSKKEQDKKEYIAKRSNDCLNIYKVESDKWNNTQGWIYNEVTDICHIRYKDPKPKSDSECDSLYPTSEDNVFIMFAANLRCKDGEIENQF